MNSNRYSEEGINDFLEELLTNKRLSDSKDEEIAKLVIERGYRILSDKQKIIFEKFISYFSINECSRCGEDIPWCEMSSAKKNGAECRWCQRIENKDD